MTAAASPAVNQEKFNGMLNNAAAAQFSEQPFAVQFTCPPPAIIRVAISMRETHGIDLRSFRHETPSIDCLNSWLPNVTIRVEAVSSDGSLKTWLSERSLRHRPVTQPIETATGFLSKKRLVGWYFQTTGVSRNDV